MRLTGRKTWGGRDSDELSRALDQIQHAFVKTNFKTKDGKYASHSFNIFPEVYLERAERETDPVETCTVTLARPIIASLEDEHFTCLNHAVMQQLGTIGQAIYMRAFSTSPTCIRTIHDESRPSPNGMTTFVPNGSAA